ncbi:hypothetical protein quinque_013516 [Culex quinquefasciatus]
MPLRLIPTNVRQIARCEEVYLAELAGVGVALAEDCLMVNRTGEDLLRHVVDVFRYIEAVTEMCPLVLVGRPR